MFGHANFEMLLQPFIGLTGKWQALTGPADFTSMSLAEQLACLDQALLARLEQDCLAKPDCLKPLPLLGVPNWYAANKNAGFYQNPAYFRPERG